MFGFSNTLKSLPPVTKNLIIANTLIWVAMWIGGVAFNNKMIDFCGLHYFGASQFNPAQIITYMFLHGGFFHLFFNMFTLLMFGVALERAFGSARFLFYYMTCGIGAALVQEGVWALTWESTLASYNGIDVDTLQIMLQNPASQHVADMFLNMMVTVGASGAIFGVLLAFAMIYPNLPTYIMFIPVPVKAKWMVLGYGAIELVLALSQPGSTIAHFAHLGGMIFGFFLVLYWRKRGDIHKIY